MCVLSRCILIGCRILAFQKEIPVFHGVYNSYYCMLLHLSCVRVFAAPWTVAHQASLHMEFSRQEYWNGLNILLQGIFPTQR